MGTNTQHCISRIIDPRQGIILPVPRKKPSKYFVSPYRRRETSISTGISQLEWDVSGSVFIMQNDPSEVLFETEQGELLTCSIYESLAPMIWVNADLINVWSSILNRDQTADGSFLSRLFMRTTTIVFFPIVAFDHYYLLVFNICKPAFNIIDNSVACNDYESKYKQVCDVVDKRQDKASAIEKAKPCVFKMKWRTLNNHDDCGVFLMCHMDTYLGQSQSAWKLDFKTENEKGKDCQRAQLTRLRAKYMSKILLHESNKHKKKIIDYAKSFNEKYGLDDGKEKV